MRLLLLFALFGAAQCVDELKKKPNLLQLAISLNLTKFVEEIRKTGIDKVINHEGKFTVFAPSDEAFAHEKCYPGEVSTKDKMRFHVAWGAIKAADIANEKTMKTLLSKRTVRLNVYNKGQVITANGRRIVSTDHEAHNGIIHVIADVMSSVYNREGSIISELDECCPQHSRLIDLVKKSGLNQVLDKRGPFTFLAPDNGAFAKLHPDYINHLIKNETALKMVLLTHVIPGTVYSAGLKNGDIVKTLSGAKLCVGIKAGVVKFGNAEVQLMDVTAGNGAVHTLDTVLFPHSGIDPSCEADPNEYPIVMALVDYHVKKPHRPDLLTALKEMQLDAFAAAIDRANLLPFIEKQPHATVFAPSDLALVDMAETDLLQDYVKSHVVPKLIRRNNFVNDAVLDTLLPDKKLRLNVHENNSKFTVNGRELKLHGHAFDNGVIYKIKHHQDIVASSELLLHQIQNDFDLSYFMMLIEGAGVADLFRQTHYPFTVFAPTNRALEEFIAAGEQTASSISKLLMNHIVPKTLHETTFEMESDVFAIGGKVLKLEQTDEGQIMLDGELVDQAPAGNPAVNGVLYKVDKIFF